MASFSDDFGRIDNPSLGANWTDDVAGDPQIVSFAWYPNTGSAKNMSVYSATTCSTANQYARIKFDIIGTGNYTGAIFRYTNSSSPHYWVYFALTEQTVTWAYMTDVASGNTDISAGTSITIAANDVFGITVNGTGTSTVVRIWRNPTALAPDDGGATWDSNAPTVTFTNDPPSPVNTGSAIGLMAYDFGTRASILEIYAGDVPVASSPIPVWLL